MTKEHRILICGGRDWLDFEMIKSFVESLPDNTVIVEGECRGVDKMARQAAELCDFPQNNILRFPANWEKYGKSSGYIRNSQMLSEGKPTLVIAFHDDIERSKGTKNMISQAAKNNIPTYLNPNSWEEVDEFLNKISNN